MTLFLTFVRVIVAVCLTVFATSFVLSAASTYLIVRVTVLLSTIFSVPCVYSITSVTSFVVGVICTTSTLVWLGAL